MQPLLIVTIECSRAGGNRIVEYISLLHFGSRRQLATCVLSGDAAQLIRSTDNRVIARLAEQPQGARSQRSDASLFSAGIRPTQWSYVLQTVSGQVMMLLQPKPSGGLVVTDVDGADLA